MEPGGDQQGAVRVFSWNLAREEAKGTVGTPDGRSLVASLLRYLREQNPDVVLLQSVPTALWDNELNAILKSKGYETVMARGPAPRPEGVILLVRRLGSCMIVSHEAVPFIDGFGSAFLARLKRPADGATFAVACVHLGRSPDGTREQAELHHLLGLLDSKGYGRPAIVAGDFNADVSNAALREELTRAGFHSAVAPIAPAEGPAPRVGDDIFVRDLPVAQTATVEPETPTSGHRPLSVEVRPAPGVATPAATRRHHARAPKRKTKRAAVAVAVVAAFGAAVAGVDDLATSPPSEFQRCFDRLHGDDCKEALANGQAVDVWMQVKAKLARFSDADDCLQDALLYVCVEHPSQPPDLCKNFKRKALWLAIDVLRQNRRVVDLDDVPADYESCPQPDVVTQHITQEEINATAAALAALPPRTRKIIRAHYIDGQSDAAIAARLGLSRSRVNALRRDGEEQLRSTFAQCFQ